MICRMSFLERRRYREPLCSSRVGSLFFVCLLIEPLQALLMVRIRRIGRQIERAWSGNLERDLDVDGLIAGLAPECDAASG